MRLLTFYLLLSLLSLAACPSTPATTASPPIQQAAAEPPTCDCCVFTERVPTAWRTRLAPDTASGTPLRLTGTVYESDGHTPARHVRLYFYHTNSRGYYAKLGTEDRTSHAWWHGYCRGWLRTDARGRYELTTIKPGAYPNRTIPAHIHFYVQAPSQRTCYYLSDFVFTGDPFLTESYWAQVEQQEGFLRYGGVQLQTVHDTLIGQRDIRLLPQFDRVPTRSGLAVGQSCPAFEPWHVWGPDRGKRTCPMCAYGQGNGVLIWTRTLDSDTVRAIARFWEAQLQHRTTSSLRAFLIYTNPEHYSAARLRPLLERFAQQAHLQRVAVLYVASPEDKESAFLYQINSAVTTTVLGYRHRQVVGNWVNPSFDDQTMQAIAASVK